MFIPQNQRQFVIFSAFLMAERLAALEEAERLVIGLLESAGQAVSELKEIQANDDEKDKSFLRGVLDHYTHLAQVKDIILREFYLPATIF
jgi:hypothetical protein